MIHLSFHLLKFWSGKKSDNFPHAPLMRRYWTTLGALSNLAPCETALSTHASMRFASDSAIKGPIKVSSFKGSPYRSITKFSYYRSYIIPDSAQSLKIRIEAALITFTSLDVASTNASFMTSKRFCIAKEFEIVKQKDLQMVGRKWSSRCAITIHKLRK